MKAICLISGGLDSTLAAKLILEQGIELVALNFKSPFCLCDRHRAGCRHEAKFVSENFGLELKFVNTSSEMLEIVKRPKFGYGSNINPCIDCRILMFKKAKEIMQEIGASFIVTGEVLAQRPMSQRSFSMSLIDKEAGVKGLVLRPLSAQLLNETIPEKNSWVDRAKLLKISGRARKDQINLAKNFAIKDYPCSAGGCLLTDPGFARRVKDLLKYKPDFNLEDIELLKVGRHFRLNDQAKFIVGRNEAENKRILTFAKEGDFTFETIDVSGPAGLLKANKHTDDISKLSASIIVYYSDSKERITKILTKNISLEIQEVLQASLIAEKEFKGKII